MILGAQHGHLAGHHLRRHTLGRILFGTRHSPTRRHLVQRWDVDPGHLHGQASEEVRSRFPAATAVAFPLGDDFEYLADRVLGVPDQGKIHEGREGFRVGRAGSSDAHKGVRLFPVDLAEAKARKIQNVEEVGVGQLGLQGETEDVVVRHRPFVLETPKGQFSSTELGLHVGPGSVHSIQQPPGVAIHDVIQNLRPGVAHSHLVRVRIAEQEPNRGTVPGLFGQAYLVSYVAVGLGDEREDFVGEGLLEGVLRAYGDLHGRLNNKRGRDLALARPRPGPLPSRQPPASSLQLPSRWITTRWH